MPTAKPKRKASIKKTFDDDDAQLLRSWVEEDTVAPHLLYEAMAEVKRGLPPHITDDFLPWYIHNLIAGTLPFSGPFLTADDLNWLIHQGKNAEYFKEAFTLGRVHSRNVKRVLQRYFGTSDIEDKRLTKWVEKRKSILKGQPRSSTADATTSSSSSAGVKRSFNFPRSEVAEWRHAARLVSGGSLSAFISIAATEWYFRRKQDYIVVLPYLPTASSDWRSSVLYFAEFLTFLQERLSRLHESASSWSLYVDLSRNYVSSLVLLKAAFEALPEAPSDDSPIIDYARVKPPLIGHQIVDTDDESRQVNAYFRPMVNEIITESAKLETGGEVQAFILHACTEKLVFTQVNDDTGVFRPTIYPPWQSIAYLKTFHEVAFILHKVCAWVVANLDENAAETPASLRERIITTAGQLIELYFAHPPTTPNVRDT